MASALFVALLTLFALVASTSGFIPNAPLYQTPFRRTALSTSLSLFGDIFESPGPLGKGIMVTQLTVCCSAPQLLNKLTSLASIHAGTSPKSLSSLASETCLALLR